MRISMIRAVDLIYLFAHGHVAKNYRIHSIRGPFGSDIVLLNGAHYKLKCTDRDLGIRAIPGMEVFLFYGGTYTLVRI